MSKYLRNLIISPESGLGLEILEILYSKNILDSLSTEYEDIYENLKISKFIQLLFDDIILRLCKISDIRNGTRSAPMIIKKFKKIHTNQPIKLQKMQKAMNKLNEYTSKLKLRRDNRIAHIGDRSKQEVWGPIPDLNEAICAAVNLVDILNGERLQYKIADKDIRGQF